MKLTAQIRQHAMLIGNTKRQHEKFQYTEETVTSKSKILYALASVYSCTEVKVIRMLESYLFYPV